MNNNFTYFITDNKPDSEFLSYFMGFLMSDGAISSKSKTVAVYSTDFDIIDKMYKRLNLDSKLGKYKCPSSDKFKYTFKLGPKIYNWFVSNFELQDVKYNHSIEKFPELFKKLNFQFDINSFIRGFFDGDGSLTVTFKRNKYCFSHMNLLGGPTLIKEISEKYPYKRIRKLSNCSKVLAIDFNSEHALNLLNKIYKDATIFMDRKYKTFSLIKDRLNKTHKYINKAGPKWRIYKKYSPTGKDEYFETQEKAISFLESYKNEQ